MFQQYVTMPFYYVQKNTALYYQHNPNFHIKMILVQDFFTKFVLYLRPLILFQCIEISSIYIYTSQ
ncbi:hypothetical protein NIES2098_18510 [Calothrix sp. NIES-2098]|nr:hypothetical protein NIES2098_18510 [Calothrix sp. NIES-2098]